MKISEKTRSKIQKYSQTIFCCLAWILLISIVIQASLASLAIFVDASFWKNHLAFIKVLEYIPALMYIIGSAGEVPQKYKAWSFMLFILCNIQYYTDRGWMGVIHMVSAFFIFMISLYVAWGSYQYLFKHKKEVVNGYDDLYKNM
ncbi:hypothetical protein EKG37_17925 [Robertmurraya yapensis]|uniref:Uncharacterized protein n=1 Tax=Bacillus yapensis TaxID=2492960 RepID=A0A431VZ62_9BACI|nr:DUF6220 domain-containing protein [Bacillus yapensis]RTR28179.1 hypothetical protein EKG37_17925 [Bacillus yapensis]TKS94423.1 hypothetical protein FAR12_17935 [Bacillus yapensis]